MTGLRWLLVACMVVACLGCELGPRSGRGFRLPEGDIERGKLAFQDLGCAECHDVVGARADAEGERASHIVTLGGEVSRIETYGELVTSIVNPSHEISRRHPRDEVSEGELSNMELKNFNDRMTVAQLIDLTFFLQSKYWVRPETNYVP